VRERKREKESVHANERGETREQTAPPFVYAAAPFVNTCAWRVLCRVKELEKANSSLTARTSTAETLLDKVKSDKSKQLKVLEDMLQFERTSFKNSEASYKTTKKALVREVKQGRAMMEQLKEEVERERREAERGNDRRSSVGLGFN